MFGNGRLSVALVAHGSSTSSEYANGYLQITESIIITLMKPKNVHSGVPETLDHLLRCPALVEIFYANKQLNPSSIFGVSHTITLASFHANKDSETSGKLQPVRSLPLRHSLPLV